MLIEEQIKLRKQRAEDEQFKVRRVGKELILSDYKVYSVGSGKTYRVAIRGLTKGCNHCSCPDYATNTLGTCKHIEAVLQRINRRVAKKDREDIENNKIEIFLSYGKHLEVKIRHPENISPAIIELKAKYFDENNILPPKKYDGFVHLMDYSEQVDEEVTISSDVIEYVEEELERRHDLSEEQRLLALLSEGKLNLNVVNTKLYTYQMKGVLFAAYRGRTIIGDEMGLGKTVQAIAATQLLRQKKGITKVLIIAPVSLKHQWKNEIKKFTQENALVMGGLKNKRMELYEEDSFYKITNYESVIRDGDLIMNWQPDMIILDEAQRIKNWETKTARAVKSLASKYSLVLTGTPMENKLDELYSIVQFVDQRRLGPAFQFFHDHVSLDKEGKLAGYKNLDRIRDLLKPIFIRRDKRSVLKQLPPKTENVYYVSMSKEQREFYDEISSVVARILTKWKKQKWLSNIDRRRLLCCIVNMRMLCDSTYLYDKKTNVSPKLKEFKELIKELCIENDKKIVVFSEWTKMLEKAAEVAEQMGIGHVLFHGGVPAKKRGVLIEQFHKEKECKIFFSTNAGGLGLNLQCADTVINLDIPWNPAVLDQRIGRVHRLGQHNPVTAINLITRNSIEERVLSTVQFKREVFKGLFEDGSSEVDLGALKKESFLNTINKMMEEEFKEREEQEETDEDEKEEEKKDALIQDEDPLSRFIDAGVMLLNNFVQQSDESKSREENSSKEGVAVKNDKSILLKEKLTKFITKDKKTGKSVLTIPLPSEDLVTKTVTAVSRFLESVK